MSGDLLLGLIEERVLFFYRAFYQGKDVSPAFQFRTEGLMEAAQLQHLATDDALQQLKRDCYQQVFAEPLSAEDLGEPAQLMTLMKRAPVYPS